ncbi:uncharacterized protein J3R85_020499 [Psidium guajava]|nr:uncharacterized protein J3R85_020499 [Psidium guajava]
MCCDGGKECLAKTPLRSFFFSAGGTHGVKFWSSSLQAPPTSTETIMGVQIGAMHM